MLRVQGVGPEGPQGVHIHQGTEVLIVQGLDLLDLVGGAEAVEEVQEGHPAVDGAQVGHGAQVHSLLGRGGRQQGKARLPHAHDVAVVAEDAQGVGAEGPGGHMEHAGQHLAGDLIHVGDHQQQALGGGIGGGQGTGLQRAVDRARGAALRLHLHHLHRLAEQVLLPVGGPLVHMLRHGRGRGDGEDPRHLGESVGDIRRRLVAVHDLDFLRHMKSPPFQSIHQAK